MAIELRMPALSPTMEKGTLAKWLVAEGDRVKTGDPIAEIETDKATMEFEADQDGRIGRLVIPEGTDDVPVGTVVALLAEDSESLPEPALADGAMASEPAGADASPAPASVTASTHAPTPPPVPDDNANATPLARRIAAIKEIALSAIEGTGPRGKIVKADLGLKPLPSAVTMVAIPAAPEAIIAPPPGVPVETVKLSNMRKTIARRLSESKRTVPHFYLTARCNLDPLLKLRGELNASLAPRGIKLSVNDMLIKAMAMALVAVPDANVQFGGDDLHRFARADISMAVAIDGGLITPVIKSANTLGLAAIAQTTKALSTKAREGKLTPEDYSGGTASISNLGMFGIDEMFPVINPPQALILGIGAGLEQPWNVDGEIRLATVMSATASFDHRAIDGAIAARFMEAFRDLVENAMAILT
ncbi:dihydrolipoamide acetyltransferase family protein [Novosphingobium album (ex Hu et al. 2023)]|uniref:Dihydrolipoamide acetyltransferase component of pyruvate dehydrogenase complex n=1 Tax=Novosphingobium album (ex Hu et al. 2023) TaxID=2930093 RepID=A0ABT0B7B7_9SPHN|nr:dihydrolipoamide acetyltransferase family protein [Novosphingobium album (ex Hu et al. 2023)]MCJ2180766.1 2-oxo acid dehydrogenase subunit E2 [Novosphingobium album (ex Hu et al. 2023)]